MASPYVAGAAALVKATDPNYSVSRVTRVRTRAASVPDGYDRACYGRGFLNIVDAL